MNTEETWLPMKTLPCPECGNKLRIFEGVKSIECRICEKEYTITWENDDASLSPLVRELNPAEKEFQRLLSDFSKSFKDNPTPEQQKIIEDFITDFKRSKDEQTETEKSEAELREQYLKKKSEDHE